MSEFWPIAFVAVVLLLVVTIVVYRAEAESRSRPCGEDSEFGGHPL